MEREEKKYAILPGVKTPDIKAIVGAASDFTNPGVEDLQIKGFDHRKTLETGSDAKAPTAEDIAKLNALGDKVAEEEARSAEESRKKMEAIKQAVSAPENLSSLQKAAAKVVSEEKKEIIEKEQAEKALKAAEEEAKLKMREERRLAQQKVLEETLAKKAELQEKNRKAAEEKAAAEAKAKKEELKAQKIAEAKAKKEEDASNPKANEDDDYKAWVKAKREAAIAEATKKNALKAAPKEVPATQETPKQEETIQKADDEKPSVADIAPVPERKLPPVAEESTGDEPKEESIPKKEVATEAPIASASETLDDFSEFL